VFGGVGWGWRYPQGVLADEVEVEEGAVEEGVSCGCWGRGGLVVIWGILKEGCGKRGFFVV